MSYIYKDIWHINEKNMNMKLQAIRCQYDANMVPILCIIREQKISRFRQISTVSNALNDTPVHAFKPIYNFSQGLTENTEGRSLKMINEFYSF